MEREHLYNNKMVTRWNDKEVKKLTFDEFKEQALQHRTYLSIPRDKRESVIKKDYESITKKDVEIDNADSKPGKVKSSKSNKSDDKAE
jgi:uncharacterized protein YnzC (UPF0291/DUF896 family)